MQYERHTLFTLNFMQRFNTNNDAFEMLLYPDPPVVIYTTLQLLPRARTLACNLTGHDRMFLASNGSRLKPCTKQHCCHGHGGSSSIEFFLYLGFLRALLLGIICYVHLQNIPRGQHLLGNAL